MRTSIPDNGDADREEKVEEKEVASPKSLAGNGKTKTVLPTSRNRGHRDLAAVAFGGGADDGTGESHFHFGCPTCSQDIVIGASERGTEKECPHCGAKFIVPDIQTRLESAGNAGVDAKQGSPGVDGSESSEEKDSSVHRLSPDRTPPLIPKDEEAAAQADELWSGGGKNNAVPAAGSSLPAFSSSDWKKVGIISAVALIAIVAAVNLLVFNSGPDELEENAPAEPVAAPEKTADDLLAEELNAFFSSFKDARSIEDRLELVRNRALAEERMNRFYSSYGLEAPLPILQLRTLKREKIFGREFVSFEAEQNRTKVHVFFEHEGGDRFKLDWESAVGYTDTNWKSFVVNQPVEAHTFRVLVSRDDYYNYKFADPSTYLCVQLVDVNGVARCYGYTKRTGAIARLLDEVLPPDSRESLPCIVTVRTADPGADRQQVYLEKLEVGWLEE
ncbi:MAG: hypothetical protein AAGJ79_12500 [Verrucomicrobiota bacterium]